MNTRRSVLLCLFSLATFLTAGNSAQAGPKPRTAEAVGVITAVGGATVPTTLTLSTRRGAVTLNVTSTTLIKVGEDEEPGTLADLVVGFEAAAKYEVATGNIQKIHVADGLEVRGTVVSTTGGQLGLDTTGDGVSDLTLAITAETQLKLGSLVLDATQLGLLQGLTVEVEYTPGTPPVATEVKAIVRSVLEAAGTVTAVDAAAGTLTIQTRSGQLLTFTVPVGAQVRLLGRTVSLSEVLVGDRVVVSYLASAGGNIALGVNILSVQPRRAVGVVTAVDLVAGTLTVQENRGSVVLTVGALTELRINGRAATLADVAAALTATNGRTVKVSAGYLSRAGVNLATDVQVNVNGRGRR